MTEIFSTLSAKEYVRCTRQQFEDFNVALEIGRQLLMEDEDMDCCIRAEYVDGEGGLVFGKDHFGCDDLSEVICAAIGKLLRTVGMEFLEFEFSQASSLGSESYEGDGCFRIYANDRVVWPDRVWPS